MALVMSKTVYWSKQPIDSANKFEYAAMTYLRSRKGYPHNLIRLPSLFRIMNNMPF